VTQKYFLNAGRNLKKTTAEKRPTNLLAGK